MRVFIKFTIVSTLMLMSLSIHAISQKKMMTPQIVGGYSDVNPKDREVRRAAAAAIRDHAKREHHAVTLVRINKAESQVVSGMNYRLCMEVRHGKRGAVHTVTAVVYQPIRKSMRLTNWEEGACKEL